MEMANQCEVPNPIVESDYVIGEPPIQVGIIKPDLTRSVID
jgi:hypothetical protein